MTIAEQTRALRAGIASFRDDTLAVARMVAALQVDLAGRPPVVTPTGPDWFAAPFHAAAACRRRLGKGVRWGVPEVRNRTTGAILRAGQPNSRGRLDRVGQFKLEGGRLFTKYVFPMDAGFPEFDLYERKAGATTATFMRKIRVPEALCRVFTKEPGSRDRDNVVVLYDRKADRAFALFSVDWERDKFTCGSSKVYPFSGDDHPLYDGHDRGSMASSQRHPAGAINPVWLEAAEPEIPWALCLSATRASGEMANPNSGRANPSAQILGRDVVWPAPTTDTGSPSNIPNGMPYGTLIGIPPWHHDKLDGIGDPIGRAFFRCLRDYGARLLDGNGETVPGDAAGRMGVLQARVMQYPDPERDFQWPAELRERCNAQLQALVPFLTPVMNTRGWSRETEQWSDGRYYVGGAGPRN